MKDDEKIFDGEVSDLFDVFGDEEDYPEGEEVKKEKREEEASAEKSMPDIEELLKPRKRIEISDIITDELLELAGDSSEDKASASNEEKTRIIGKADETVSVVLDKTAAAPKKMIERPGIVTRRSTSQATADLDPLPTILSAEEAEEEKTQVTSFIRRPKFLLDEEDETEIEGQIRFDAFDTDDDETDEIDEYEAEENLKESRKDKVRGFKLFGISELAGLGEDDETDNEYDDDDDEEDIGKALKDKFLVTDGDSFLSGETKVHTELNSSEDFPKVRAFFASEKTKSLLGAFAALAGALVYVVLSLTVFKGGDVPPSAQGIVNTAVVCVALLACGERALKGVLSLVKSSADADTAVFITGAAALIQGIWALASDESSVPLYGSLFALTAAFNLFGHYLIASRGGKNLEALLAGGERYAVSTIKDKETAAEVGKGLLSEEPKICCSAKAGFPGGFVENTYANDPGNVFAKISVPLFFVLSLVLGIAYGIVSENAFGGFSAFAAAVCLCMPGAALIASNLPLKKAASKLLKEGAVISGHGAVEELGSGDGVLIDSGDIFSEGGCTIYGIKTYYNMRIDEAILDTAAVVIAAGSPAGEVFGRVILGKKELLPEVENLVYEDRLGLSAWIGGRRILVGNRDLLINHNVSAPDKETEARYRHDDRQVMYLAVAGKIAAMFVVGYGANPGIGKALREMEKKGLNIFVRTSDANITEELISNFFSLHKNAVKVISSVAGDMYRQEREKTREGTEAKVINDGKVGSMLRAVSAAQALYFGVKPSALVQTVFAGLGFGILTLLLFLSGFSLIPPYALVVYQLAALGVVCGVSLIRKGI